MHVCYLLGPRITSSVQRGLFDIGLNIEHARN
jgi:hypothetical protein